MLGQNSIIISTIQTKRTLFYKTLEETSIGKGLIFLRSFGLRIISLGQLLSTFTAPPLLTNLFLIARFTNSSASPTWPIFSWNKFSSNISPILPFFLNSIFCILLASLLEHDFNLSPILKPSTHSDVSSDLTSALSSSDDDDNYCSLRHGRQLSSSVCVCG